MNTINASTQFTPFQLRFGKAARILPPVILPENIGESEQTVLDIITRMQPMQMEAQDNLLIAKVWQAHQENTHRQLAFPFKVGGQVVLSTAHRCRIYKTGDERHIAMFVPHFDGLYPIISTNERHSTVTLALPNYSLYSTHLKSNHSWRTMTPYSPPAHYTHQTQSM